MVRIVVLLAVAVSVVLGAPKTGRVPFQLATSCDPEKCRLPDCRCFSTDIPGNLEPSETPQVILNQSSIYEPKSRIIVSVCSFHL